MLSEIGAYLATKSVGAVGTDIFLGLMPDQPDSCIALFEYAGSSPDLHWNGEYPGLQVRVRDTSYAAAREKIGEIMAVLHGLYEQTLSDGSEGDGEPEGDGDEGPVGDGDEGDGGGEPTPANGTRYLLIKARGSPEILKRDASNRVELVLNFEIIKERD